MPGFAKPTFDSSLTRACLSHLHDELVALESQLAAMNDVRLALMDRDLSVLERTHAKQVEATSRATELRKARKSLVGRLADVLQIDHDEVTLSRIASRAEPELRGQLLDMQRRLQTTAEEVISLRHKNMLIMQRSAEILRHLMAQLTGETEFADCYTSDGQTEFSDRGGVVRTEC